MIIIKDEIKNKVFTYFLNNLKIKKGILFCVYPVFDKENFKYLENELKAINKEFKKNKYVKLFYKNESYLILVEPTKFSKSNNQSQQINVFKLNKNFLISYKHDKYYTINSFYPFLEDIKIKKTKDESVYISENFLIVNNKSFSWKNDYNRFKINFLDMISINSLLNIKECLNNER